MIFSLLLCFSFAAISELVNDPPDNGSLCGYSVKYIGACIGVSPVLQPCVLLVKGLPDFAGIQMAFEHYIKNISEVSPVYCHVNGQEAVVKFDDDQGECIFLIYQTISIIF